MKKVLYFITLLLLAILLTGCDIFGGGNNTTTATVTTHTTTVTTNIITEIGLILNDGQDTVEINSPWVDEGAQLDLLLDGTKFDMITNDTVDITTLGLYEITYDYTYGGTEYSMTRYVIVTDQTAPVIELNIGVDTVKLNDAWTDGGVTTIDNSGESILAVVSGSVDTSTTGTYQIVYTATDSSGNTSSIIRYVTVYE